MPADARPAGAAAHPGRAHQRAGWLLLKRVAIGLFFVAVAWLLARHARTVDWQAVAAVVRGYAVSSLLLAAALAAASYCLYCCYDLIGRRQVGHPLRTTQVLATAFVSYAFNLNLGALVGGVAMRYRLYSRLGLAGATITQVLTMSVLTNWLGYLLLAGVALLAFPSALAQRLPLGGARLTGMLLLALPLAYLLACSTVQRRVWHLRGRELRLPSGGIALLQLALSCANWMTIAGVVAVLLQGRIDYLTVLGVLLVAAVAAAVVHVPAGLGVLEAVFIALMSRRVPVAELLGALLAYRLVYYLLPLGLALVLYFTMEAQAKRTGAAREEAEARCSLPGA